MRIDITTSQLPNAFKTIAGSHVELHFAPGGLSSAISLKKRLIFGFHKKLFSRTMPLETLEYFEENGQADPYP